MNVNNIVKTTLSGAKDMAIAKDVYMIKIVIETKNTTCAVTSNGCI